MLLFDEGLFVAVESLLLLLLLLLPLVLLLLIDVVFLLLLLFLLDIFDKIKIEYFLFLLFSFVRIVCGVFCENKKGRETLMQIVYEKLFPRTIIFKAKNGI